MEASHPTIYLPDWDDGPPGPPRSPVVLACGVDVATGLAWVDLAWSAGERGTAPVQDYVVRWQYTPTWYGQTPPLPALPRRVILRDLPAATPRTQITLALRVRAVDADGRESAWSASVVLALPIFAGE